MLFKSSFQMLAAMLSKCSQLVGLWLGVKRFFTSVWHVFFPQFVQYFLAIAFFMAFGFLLGVLTISFALPIGLYKSLWNSENVSLQRFKFKI